MNVSKATPSGNMEAALAQLAEGPERRANHNRPIELQLGTVKSGAEARTLVYKTSGPLEIQVTHNHGDWVRRDVIEPNPLKRAWDNMTAKSRVAEDELSGGPPVYRAIDLRTAAKELAGMRPAEVLNKLAKELPKAVALEPEVKS